MGGKELTPVEAAYIAGLIDGEGSITLSKKHRNENRQLVISVSSTDHELLGWMLQTIRAGKITSKKKYSEKHISSYTYQITNRQALELLTQVTPCLRTYKKRRAELVLEKYRALTPRNGKYSAELSAAREEFVRNFLAITSRGSPCIAMCR